MIFVDTNVFMYAVGGAHPLREPARAFFLEARRERTPLCTSAEVLQELMHVYLRTERQEALDAAWSLVTRFAFDVWALERDDVELARQLAGTYPGLEPRDLCHLASCRRRRVTEMKTFDRALGAAALGPAAGA